MVNRHIFKSVRKEGKQMEDKKNIIKKRLKKNNLMDAAFSLFTEKGFSNTSIADIAEKAKVAKGTFYLYFKDKYDIRSIITMYKAEMVFRRAWEECEIKPSLSFENVVLKLSSKVLDILAEDHTLTSFLLKNLSFGMFRKGESVFGDDSVDIYTLVEETLRRSKVKYNDPEIMLYMIFELIGSAGYSSIVDSTPVPVKELKPHLLKTVKGIMKMYEAEA
jgi:AcrR family transcriptional regulator